MCFSADSVIEKALDVAPSGSCFITVYVGDRPTWKDPKCVFRTHEKTRLKSVPTLIRVGSVSYPLHAPLFFACVLESSNNINQYSEL